MAMAHANRTTAAKESTARVTCEYSHLSRMDFQFTWLQSVADLCVPKNRDPAVVSFCSRSQYLLAGCVTTQKVACINTRAMSASNVTWNALSRGVKNKSAAVAIKPRISAKPPTIVKPG